MKKKKKKKKHAPMAKRMQIDHEESRIAKTVNCNAPEI